MMRPLPLFAAALVLSAFAVHADIVDFENLPNTNICQSTGGGYVDGFTIGAYAGAVSSEACTQVNLLPTPQGEQYMLNTHSQFGEFIPDGGTFTLTSLIYTSYDFGIPIRFQALDEGGNVIHSRDFGT